MNQNTSATPVATKLTGVFITIAILVSLLIWWLWSSADYRLTSSTTGVVLIGLIVFLTVVLIAGMVIAQSLTSRLRNLRDGAINIASGNLSASVHDTTGDEIGQVAAAFNQLATRTRDTYQRLAFEKQQAQTLLESIGEGMVAVDQNGKIVLLNSNAATLFSIQDRQAAIGKPVTDLVHLWQQKHLVSKTDHPGPLALKKGKHSNDTYELQNHTDKPQIIHVTTDPVVVENNIAGAILLIRDVTKEKEIDRMKTEFISLASHQLRTPLSAIKWFSEMLISGDAGKLSSEQIDFVKNIADSTERMIELVNSLLNISRIESGRIIIDPRPTDLQELVTSIVNDLKAKTEERQQTLIISVHKDLPKINLDARLIGQVYLNLLTNAIKYTPKKGEITVFVSKKDNQVVSQVTDNGYGIPVTEQGKLFQKFFRATNVAKVETDGTGLGMYLVKAIIESSGGKIWFKSEEGKGTTFWFSLPLSGMKAKEGEVTLDN